MQCKVVMYAPMFVCFVFLFVCFVLFCFVLFVCFLFVVCLYFCLFVCLYVCMFVCMYACMHALAVQVCPLTACPCCQDGLTGSAWGDWANYTASPLR